MRGTDGGASVAFRYSPGVVILAFALIANAASCQPRGPSAKPTPGVQVRFVCNTGYSVELCRRQMEVLRGVLSRYPSGALGDWTWVLVRSGDWKPMKRRLRLDADSPAFSFLPAGRRSSKRHSSRPRPDEALS
jgi:hypothetical protein